MRTLLIVFHSLTGGTRQMAGAAARGAEAQSDVSVRLLPAVQAQPADVLGADGYIFATPEMLAAVSGLMKDFFDRTYYPALERINGRPYAVLICDGAQHPALAAGLLNNEVETVPIGVAAQLQQ